MTNIIAPEDVDARRYPGQDSQYNALQELGQLIGPTIDDECSPLEGIIAYGGSTFMRPDDPINRTSDIDIYGLMADEDLRMRKEVEKVLGELAARHNVHIDLHLTTRPMVHTGRDGMASDPLSADYLRQVAEVSPYVFGQPLFGIRAINEYPRAKRLGLAVLALESYVAHKIQRFTNAVPRIRRESEVLHLMDLQRALEVTGAVARKFITANALKQRGIASCVLGGRIAVENERGTLPLSDEWHALFTMLQAHRDAYVDVLEDRIAGRVSTRAYRGWLLENQPGIIEHAHDFAVVSGDEIYRLLA